MRAFVFILGLFCYGVVIFSSKSLKDHKKAVIVVETEQNITLKSLLVGKTCFFFHCGV